MAFNDAPSEELSPVLHACCDVPSWVRAVLDGRPYRSREELLQRADQAARRLTESEVDRALAAHPRIGERASGEDTESAWSRSEQSGVERDEDTARKLTEANRAYEQRFGHVFLICATGLGSGEVLSALESRLDNDQETERGVVADELRKIALLRLERVLDT
ncbi:2-oxo-4-hydroxy-4-carboxy-5-ureidoimidazoline decarboxylase [Haloechinothrix sp. LS1_15]|uniref:2-oxo-4-hydroxy-4-carboxy-5-ureidoimidazoline decarboxylase n=1 Tax=Haloechinothrix sp. LS1_15 TaxID=2652248 RepID=UPI00294B6D12|nr:2-oxo-4-hydroxy-4-carboxy-5-ureidoimidazoline decarboxylase [Haloechinothrix sp. LS1_15]